MAFLIARENRRRLVLSTPRYLSGFFIGLLKMNYYQFHIGDFRSGTVNMSRKARWIYRDMLDAYYDTERPLPADMDILCDMLGVEDEEERKIVERHLRFKFEASEDGYVHPVCESVIAEYRAKADVARANGKRGGRPRNNPEKPSGFPSGSDSVAICNQDESGLKTNHKPITNNQEPITKVDQEPLPSSPAKTARKTKIPDPFMLTADMRQWAAETAPAVDVRSETENFVDYWRGEAKTKADWPATWRNWMRRAQKDAGSRRGQPGGFVNRQQQIEDENMRVVAEIAARSRGQQDDFIGTGEVIIEGEVIHAH